MRRSLCLALTLLVSACTASEKHTSPAPFLATTTVLASLANEVTGTRATVSSLVPIGASVEEYDPTPQDVARVHDARVLFENGDGLEVWIDRLVANASSRSLQIDILSRGLPTIEGNPHLWLDPKLASVYVDRIRQALIIADPDGRDQYTRNARAFQNRLARLDTAIKHRIASVPTAQRSLIVYHDAWPYYARAFGLRILGSIEPSPGREPSAHEIAALIDLAREHHVRTIFAEPEYSPKLAHAVASGLVDGGVVALYDDGSPTPGGTYIDMLQADTDRIVAGIR